MKFFSKFYNKSKVVKQFIDVLITNTNYKEVKDFLKKQGKNFLVNLPEGEVIRQILKMPWSRRKYIACVGLSEMVHIEGSRNFDNSEKSICLVPQLFEDFKYFIKRESLFGMAQIPWHEWEDMEKLKIDVLKEIFEKGALHFFGENFHEIHFKITYKPLEPKGDFSEMHFQEIYKKGGLKHPFPSIYKSYMEFGDKYWQRRDELLMKGYSQLDSRNW